MYRILSINNIELPLKSVFYRELFGHIAINSQVQTTDRGSSGAEASASAANAVENTLK